MDSMSLGLLDAQLLPDYESCTVKEWMDEIAHFTLRGRKSQFQLISSVFWRKFRDGHRRQINAV
jgi:hypothetical protein